MSDPLKFSKRLKTIGWKVKLYGNERLEPPHITLRRGIRKWRIGLRDMQFLESSDSWDDIDPEVIEQLNKAVESLREAWDKMYPSNPVSSEKDEDDGR
jgi:hypothetical protein